MAYAELSDAEHLREIQAGMKRGWLKRAAAGLLSTFLRTFEESISVDTPAFRAYRDTRAAAVA